MRNGYIETASYYVTVIVNSTSDNRILLLFIGPKKISCELRSNKLLFQRCS